MSYSDDLTSPLWQKKRLEIMQRDSWRCQMCGTDKNSLTVHHLYYEAGKKPHEYDNDVLITLCKDCHRATHGEIAKISSLIAYSIVKKRKNFIQVEEVLKTGGLI
jgi:5-methylcytosine-specific restriction endonuclease McrA